MKKSVKRSPKSALALSVLALALCVSMLVGTTFAWFSESIANNANQIIAGNLDVVLEYYDKAADTWKPVEEDTPLFDSDARWEPGSAQQLALRIANAGELALKYQLNVSVLDEVAGVNVAGESFKLSEYIRFGVVEHKGVYATRDEAITAVSGTATPLSTQSSTAKVLDTVSDTEDFVTVVLYMPKTVGNEANAKNAASAPKIALGISLIATQTASESDGFDNTYDDGAFADVVVTTPDALAAAVLENDVVALANSIALDQPLAITKDVTVIGNGNTLSLGDTTQDRVINVANATEDVTVTLKGIKLDSTATSKYYDRGLSLYNNAGTVTLNLDGCSFTSNYYALNIGSKNAEVLINANNCTFTGPIAINIWSPTKGTFKNCTVNGVNVWSNNATYPDANDSAAIQLNTDANGTAKNCDIDFVNCTVAAYEKSTAADPYKGKEYHFNDKVQINNTVDFIDCTFLHSGVAVEMNQRVKIAVDTADLQNILDNATGETTVALTENVAYGTVYLRQSAVSTSVDYTDWGGGGDWERERTIEDLTIIGAEGATLKKVVFACGDALTGEYNATGLSSLSSYLNAKNLTFKNVTFDGSATAFGISAPKGAIDGLTFDGCTMVATAEGVRLLAISASGSDYGPIKAYKNVTVTGCTVKNAHQVMDVRGIENLTVTNNTFDGITGRDLMLSGGTKNFSGNIVISNNVSSNGGERFLRIADATGMNLTVTNNTIINYNGADDDYIKIGSCPAGAVVDGNTATALDPGRVLTVTK